MRTRPHRGGRQPQTGIRLFWRCSFLSLVQLERLVYESCREQHESWKEQTFRSFTDFTVQTWSYCIFLRVTGLGFEELDGDFWILDVFFTSQLKRYSYRLLHKIQPCKEALSIYYETSRTGEFRKAEAECSRQEFYKNASPACRRSSIKKRNTR